METMANDLSRYEGAVIIAPEEEREYFLRLREASAEVSFDFYTRENLFDTFAYSFDERAVTFMLNKGYSYPLALDMLSAMSRMLKDEYLSEKLRMLVPLRDELIVRGLLYKTPYPERSFLGRNVLIRDYPSGDKIVAALAELPNMAVSYDIMPSHKKNTQTVHAFTDVYEELHYVFNLIAQDIDHGSAPESIYLLGVDESYADLLGQYASRYGFSINFTPQNRLYDSGIYHRFRHLYGESNLASALQTLEKEYPLSPDFDQIYRFAKRFDGVYADARQLRLYDEIAKTLKESIPTYKNAVRIASSYWPIPDAHYYLINFSLGTYPKTIRDEGYLLDVEKTELGLMTSRDLMAEQSDALANLLNSDAVRSISYAILGTEGAKLRSSLVGEFGYAIQESNILFYEYSQSKGAFLKASLLDEKEHYLRKDPRLLSLSQNIELTGYPSYNPHFISFSLVDPQAERHYSYSSLKTYYSCPFSYYLKYVLHLEESESHFSAKAGLIFHDVLSHMNEKDFVFDVRFAEARQKVALAEGAFSNKEQMLLVRLKGELAKAIGFYRQKEAGISNAAFMTEKPFLIQLASKPAVYLEGRIDKVVTFGQSSEYMAVLDYKTNQEAFDQDLVEYGLSLQLPIYAYVSMNDQDESNRELVGLFIGHVLPSRLVKPFLSSDESFSEGFYRLRGVYTSSIEKLRLLDNFASKSTFIAGLGYNDAKGAFSKSAQSSLKAPSELALFAQQGKEKTLEADVAIRRNSFEIAPKVYAKKQFDSCRYCQFRDVCYRRDEWVVRLPTRGANLGEEDEADETEDVD
jgi:hypothetical protein